MDDETVNKVVERIKVLKPKWQVYLEYQGCISIAFHHIQRQLWWGTVNENWGADVNVFPQHQNWGFLPNRHSRVR